MKCVLVHQVSCSFRGTSSGPNLTSNSENPSTSRPCPAKSADLPILGERESSASKPAKVNLRRLTSRRKLPSIGASALRTLR